MKFLILGLMLTFSVRSVYAGETKRVSVNGLVCAFCASKVESNFKKMDAVESIKVNLDENLEDKINDSYVLLTFKDGKTISDEEIKKAITNAGFEVVSIEISKK